MIVESDSLSLRYYIDGDEDAIFRYTNDVKASKYLARLRHESQDQTRNMLANLAMPDSLDRYGKCIWLIANASNQQTIGYLTLIKDASTAELHIGLIKSAWGKGYGSQALRLAANHLLETMRFKEVVSFTDITHQAARAAFEKAGFQPLKVKRQFYIAPQLSGAKRDVISLVYKP